MNTGKDSLSVPLRIFSMVVTIVAFIGVGFYFGRMTGGWRALGLMALGLSALAVNGTLLFRAGKEEGLSEASVPQGAWPKL